MSLTSAARNQITRYGYKGAAKLIPLIGKSQGANLLQVSPSFGLPVNLASYVGSFGAEQINNETIFADDIKVMAAPDSDWDGIVVVGSKLDIEGKVYDIIKTRTYRIKQAIAYVSLQVRG